MSGPTKTCGRPSWEVSAASSSRTPGPTTLSWARTTVQLDLLLGLQRHVPGGDDAPHAQGALRARAPAGNAVAPSCLAGLDWEADDEAECYLLLVDYDFPPEAHDYLDWAPPARMKVGPGMYGPHTAAMAASLGVAPSPCEKLVPFLGMHVCEGVDGKRLKFLRDVLGARVWRLHRAYRFRCEPFMAGFMGLKHRERRELKEAGSVGREGGEAHPERHLRPVLHEPRQVQEHHGLRGPRQVRAGSGQAQHDQLRVPDQRLGGFFGLRGDAQDEPQHHLPVRADREAAARCRSPSS